VIKSSIFICLNPWHGTVVEVDQIKIGTCLKFLQTFVFMLSLCLDGISIFQQNVFNVTVLNNLSVIWTFLTLTR
jgi:hypothetical protein